MSSRGSGASVGAGLLVGVMIGVAIGVLYAPYSGRVTRRFVDMKIHEATRKAERIIEEAKARAADITKEAKSAWESKQQ